VLTITSVLSLFVLLILASVLFFVARKIKLPYTVLLVLVGLLIVPLAQLPVLKDYLGFLDDAQLTPELLFYIFLPILIFESGFNMNIRKMIDSSWTIGLLSIVGLFISAFGIAIALFLILPLVGVEIPFVVALLFGSVISATDPVAVLALFKDFGAPKRLTMIFEGESLFNDGTAVALFMVVLAVATSGFHGGSTILEGATLFGGMLVFGVLFGLLMAALFSVGLRVVKSNEFVSVTMLIVSAHVTFILAELINEQGFIHVSAIISATVSSLFLGNYSRHILSAETDRYLNKFVEHTAFIANSLVFILAGMLFASTDVDIAHLWLPVVATVVVVIAVRALSVYLVTTPINIFNKKERMPGGWQALLSWGSLRGALAIIIVLLIPDDLAVQGWQYEYSPKEFILALTTGCILATLFIKAPLMGKVMSWLKIDQPDPLKTAYESDLGLYYLLTEQNRLKMHRTRGFVSDEHYGDVRVHLQNRIDQVIKERDELVRLHGKGLLEQSIRMMAIQIERTVLKQLFINREITEEVYRRLIRKLNHQEEKIELAEHKSINPSVARDKKDIFDTLVAYVQRPMERFAARNVSIPEQQLQYYRAQMIMARKTVKLLDVMQSEHEQPVFDEESYQTVRDIYEEFRVQNAKMMDAISSEHKKDLGGYLAGLAQRSIRASGGRALDFLEVKGIATESITEEIEHRYSVKW
jgi:CPA1 family monovalent cation:H+ antiporter